MAPTADGILIERARADFEEGLAHTRAQLKAEHGRFVAASLDAALMSAISALRVREQMRDDVRVLLDLAHRVAKGEDADKLATDNLERVLRIKTQMHFIARDTHPDFKLVLDRSRETFAKRLPDLAKMASVQEPKDYNDLVRRAFPDREPVDRIVDENYAYVIGLLDHIERHPHLLRIPQSLVPKIAKSTREMVDWQTAKVRAGIDEIYAQTPSTTGL